MPALSDSLRMRPSGLVAVDARGRRLGRVVEIRRDGSTGRVTAVVRRGRLRLARELDLTGGTYEPGQVRLPR